MARLRGAVVLALAAASRSASALSSTREISQPATDGVPKSLSKGPRTEEKKVQPTKIEMWRKDSIKRLEGAEKAFKLGQNQNDQVMVGLRQEIRARLKECADNGAAKDIPRTMVRIEGMLLKSISDSARVSLERAKATNRTKTLEVAIASSLGKFLEIENLASVLNGTEVDPAILAGRFKFEEVMPTQSHLDKEKSKTGAKAQLAAARLVGFEGPKKVERMQKALTMAESAGVEDKDLQPTRLFLAAADNRQKAVDKLRSSMKSRNIDDLEDAIEVAQEAKVNKAGLTLSKAQLVLLKENEHSREIRAQNLELNKLHKQEVLELRAQKREKAEEKRKLLELRREKMLSKEDAKASK